MPETQYTPFTGGKTKAENVRTGWVYNLNKEGVTADLGTFGPENTDIVELRREQRDGREGETIPRGILLYRCYRPQIAAVVEEPSTESLTPYHENPTVSNLRASAYWKVMRAASGTRERP